jgi:hypothetical protein
VSSKEKRNSTLKEVLANPDVESSVASSACSKPGTLEDSYASLDDIRRA